VLRRASQPAALFSGGSLIVGGAARTDLIAPDATEPLTRAQFRTLTRAFTALPDETLLYPTHGGGSFCSAGSGGERTSTLGAERASNPAMSVETEDEFVRWFPATFPAAPAYFFRMRAFNQAGPRLRRDVAMPRPLSAEEFDDAAGTALVIDTRSVERYSVAHISGSLHIAFRDVFPIWLGWLVAPDARLLFVAERTSLDAITDECLLVGHENFAGWLDGGIEAWRASGRPVSSVGFVEGGAARALVADGADVIDVREADEFARGHVPSARHIPLGTLPQHELNGSHADPVVVYCGHGERSSTAASILERKGYRNVANVRGGLPALQLR
jgi:rhodanese-related sulfurtransferase